MPNIVYIATSLDGYIADKEEKLDWLHEIPNPEQSDCGWSEFMDRIDAIIMGRKTFETVCSFDCEWPYSKPVFVLSQTLNHLDQKYQAVAEIVRDPPVDLVRKCHDRGYQNLYIDGGSVIQSFLKEDLIDEMIITRIPILLGGGVSLFGGLENPLRFKHHKTEILLNDLVKSHYLKNT